MTIDTDYPKDGNAIRGSFLKKEQWYSICSQHRIVHTDCPRCRCGSWININKRKVSSLLYKVWPWAWRKRANRKNSHFNRWLKTVSAKRAFPNMKGK